MDFCATGSLLPSLTRWATPRRASLAGRWRGRGRCRSRRWWRGGRRDSAQWWSRNAGRPTGVLRKIWFVGGVKPPSRRRLLWIGFGKSSPLSESHVPPRPCSPWPCSRQSARWRGRRAKGVRGWHWSRDDGSGRLRPSSPCRGSVLFERGVFESSERQVDQSDVAADSHGRAFAVAQRATPQANQPAHGRVTSSDH